MEIFLRLREKKGYCVSSIYSIAEYVFGRVNCYGKSSWRNGSAVAS